MRARGVCLCVRDVRMCYEGVFMRRMCLCVMCEVFVCAYVRCVSVCKCRLPKCL